MAAIYVASGFVWRPDTGADGDSRRQPSRTKRVTAITAAAATYSAAYVTHNALWLPVEHSLMPTLTIEGHQVPVDDSFLKLSPDQQNAAVEQIASRLGLAPKIGNEISSGITGALQSAGKSIADYLNPFSEARHASYARQASEPLGQALKDNLSQIAGTGAALASPVTTAGNVVNEAV